MATVQGSTTARAESRRFRWTSDDYYRLAELGFFRRRRVELIEGEIWEISINPPHSISLERTARILCTLFGPEFRVRIQSPIDLGRHNQPEPDAAIMLAGGPDAQAHPRSALLVIEISGTSLRKDRKLVAHVYARAGLSDYWIINVKERQLEVHRDPGPDPARKGRFFYRSVTIVPEAGNMAPLAAPGSPIAVASLLP